MKSITQQNKHINLFPVRTVKCSVCKCSGHNKTSCGKRAVLNRKYDKIVEDVISVAKTIPVSRLECDGRMESAFSEKPFLSEMKNRLSVLNPAYKIIISPPRSSCDMMIETLRINLKLTNCKTADNSVSKPAIYYSTTGLINYPESSTWNDFYEHMTNAKMNGKIKRSRERMSEYHYLVKNKITGEVLFKSIFDVHTYISNPSNVLQINWKKEFSNIRHHTNDDEYVNKVSSLLLTIQTSIRRMIERTKNFALADINSLMKF